MLSNLGKIIAQGYLLLLTAATGGLVGANIMGFIPLISENFFNADGKAPRPEVHLRWMHAGWVVGAGIFLAGGVMEMQRRRAAKRTAARIVSDERPDNVGNVNARGHASRHGVLATAAVGSIVGGFLGMMLGGSFLLLWFALAYSPFQPAGWTGSIKVSRLSEGIHNAPTLTTRHPVALYAFFAPIVIGAVGGALAGGIGRIAGKVSATGSFSKPKH